jgi:hypothetical protein
VLEFPLLEQPANSSPPVIATTDNTNFGFIVDTLFLWDRMGPVDLADSDELRLAVFVVRGFDLASRVPLVEYFAGGWRGVDDP